MRVSLPTLSGRAQPSVAIQGILLLTRWSILLSSKLIYVLKARIEVTSSDYIGCSWRSCTVKVLWVSMCRRWLVLYWRWQKWWKSIISLEINRFDSICIDVNTGSILVLFFFLHIMILIALFITISLPFQFCSKRSHFVVLHRLGAWNQLDQIVSKICKIELINWLRHMEHIQRLQQNNKSD